MPAIPDEQMQAHNAELLRLRAENERLRDVLRVAYQYAWNIEQKSQEQATVLRAKEIKKVTMDALKEANGTKVA